MPLRFTLLLFGIFVLLSLNAVAQQAEEIQVRFNVKKTFQTIRNFSASDAWSAQFVGNWPEAKKKAIADWLFSLDTLANGNPKGIGLSMWRFNIGAGSAEQGRQSGIRDEWRRAPAFSTDSPKVAGQLWFLQAARQRGVAQFLGFYNSPPVHLTKNGKAFATGGKSNMDSLHYSDFARYTTDIIKGVQQSTGIQLDYISPVNEPQWDWSDGGQEGCPYTNAEISKLIKSFNQVFLQNKIRTKLLIAESGHLKYLLSDADKPYRGNQINDFFQPASPHYIGNLPTVATVMAAHSYFTTSPYPQAVALRHEIRNRIDSFSHLEYWQSEYCILGDNAGEIMGNKKDVGMNAALYLAKVIHADLAEANAAAWQWWTAISAYDYKDGLVYIDKNEKDGNFSDSKMLWALGNYSRFIRPGMKRIEVTFPGMNEVFISGFYNSNTKEIVSVLINTGDKEQTIGLGHGNKHYKTIQAYITNDTENLGKHRVLAGRLVLPPKSILTVTLK